MFNFLNFRRRLPFFLCCVISVALLSGAASIVKTQTTILHIDPSPVNVPIGNNFTVTLNIQDVTDLWAWEVIISFDPSQVNCAGAEEGPFLKNNGPTIWLPPEIDNTTGRIHMACSLLTGPSGASGSGVLAYVYFKCINIGTSFIHIEESLLTNSFGEPLPHSSLDSQVDQYQPQTGYGPRADKLEIQFYETQEQAFQALMANETDVEQAQVTDDQAWEATAVDFVQLSGRVCDFYKIRRHTWAVLIAGGRNTQENYARFWNDLGEAYSMLKQMGYTNDEIYVLYADGNPPSATNCPDPSHVYAQYNNMPINYSATKANLRKVCSYIQGNLSQNGNDTLFVFTTDHGRPSGGEIYLDLWGERISREDFANASYFGGITQVALKVFLLEQCNSGGFIYFLKDSQTVIATATDAVSKSWPCDNRDNQGNNITEGYYDEFSFHFIAALKGTNPYGNQTDADANDDDYISIKEVFDYAKEQDSRNQDNPKWSDLGGNGDKRFPKGHYVLIPKSNNLYGTHYMVGSNNKDGPDNYWTFLRANCTNGVIRYALPSIPNSMNVITASNDVEWACLNRIYDGLLTFSPYDPSIKTGLRPRMAWNWDLSKWNRTITNEFLGYGNETLSEFYMLTTPLVQYSETVYINSVPQVRGIDYVIDYATGLINFTTPPPVGVPVTADYQAPCTKVIFYLRENIYWHDFEPCTAEDVYFTIEYIKSFPETAANHHLVKNVHHVEVIDPYTIVVYEDILNPWALWWIGSLPIIPRHIFQKISDPTGYTPGYLPPEQILIGCGPWRFQQLNSSNNIVLMANREYYLKTPPIGEVDYHMEVDYRPLNPKTGYRITILDIVRICAAYGSQGYEIPDENFDPGCDINPGGHTCTINILDIVTATAQYGMQWGISGIPP